VALAGYAAVGIQRSQADAVRRRSLLLFGLVNLYLVWWLVAAIDPPVYQAGSTEQPQMRLEDFKVVEYALFGGLGLVFTLVAGSKIGHQRLTPSEQAGWATLCFAMHLGLVVGLYLVTNNRPGSPAVAWLAAYALAASLVWAIVVFVPRTAPSPLAESAAPTASGTPQTGKQEPKS
jgi:hypothetical protein